MKKILIASGSEIINEALAAKLQSKYDVYVCIDSHSIIEVLDQVRPDALIINLCLPNITGIEVLRNASYKPKAIIALTPIITDQIIYEAHAAGISALIRLPFSINCIISHLDKLLPSS